MSKIKSCKNNHYTCTFKKKVVFFAEKHTNREAARKFGISKSNVSRWRKYKAELQDSMPLQQRMLITAPQLQIPSSSESPLQSQPLSPTKLKVTRQSNLQTYSGKVTEMLPTMPSDEVCLRWNSHHSNMQTSFPQLLEKERYVDVTLVADGQTLKCHRIILSSCSTYFEEILSDITPTQHPVIILKGIPFWILKSLTDFMYVGEVNIDQNKLPELLDVAELLKVKGLAGKSTPSNKQESQPAKNQPVKKPQMKEVRQQIVKAPQAVPVPIPILAKIEDMPISDPLELFEPKFQEDVDGSTPKTKEKLTSKKILTKKIRKRKSFEDEIAAPPLFPMRRGTRSRPNVKIPKYYDYEDIVKPTATDNTQPHSPGLTIKSEPLDVEESDIFNESGTSSINITSENESILSRNSDVTNISTNSKSAEKPPYKTEAFILKSKFLNKDKDQPATQYKIKIKSFSSLSEISNCKSLSADDAQESPTSTTLVSDKSSSVVKCDDNETVDDSQIDVIGMDASDTVEEQSVQNGSVTSEPQIDIAETKIETPEVDDKSEPLLKTEEEILVDVTET